MNRAEHLQWCKDRALAELDYDDGVTGAIASMFSDLHKWEGGVMYNPVQKNRCVITLKDLINGGAGMTTDEIAAIKARCEAATPGTWYMDDYCDDIVFSVDPYGHGDMRIADMRGLSANADFIAHARQDIPALLDALVVVTARAEALERAIKRCTVPDICRLCVKYSGFNRCSLCNVCDGEFNHWEFDQDRFAGKYDTDDRA